MKFNGSPPCYKNELAVRNYFHTGDRFSGNARVAGPLRVVLGCQKVVREAGHSHALSVIPLFAAAFAVDSFVFVADFQPTSAARELRGKLVKPLFLLHELNQHARLTSVGRRSQYSLTSLAEPLEAELLLAVEDIARARGSN